jgi:hypothetical protein
MKLLGEWGLPLRCLKKTSVGQIRTSARCGSAGGHAAFAAR